MPPTYLSLVNNITEAAWDIGVVRSADHRVPAVPYLRIFIAAFLRASHSALCVLLSLHCKAIFIALVRSRRPRTYHACLQALYPVSRLVRGLVSERDEDTRGSVDDGSVAAVAPRLVDSVAYALQHAITSAIIVLCIFQTIFQFSNLGYIWVRMFSRTWRSIGFTGAHHLQLIFFLFGLSSTTYAYIVSTLFNRAKTATVLGLCYSLRAISPSFPLGATQYCSDPGSSESLITDSLCAYDIACRHV